MFYYLSCLYNNFVIFYREGDPEQIKRFAKNVEVIKYQDKYGTIKCKRFFCNYGLDIPVEAEESYHIIHCDYKHTKFAPIMYPGFKYIGVSKLACNSFKELTGVEAECIYNPVAIEVPKVEKSEKMLLISATRLTSEKGGARMNKLARLLDAAGVDYEWHIYTNKLYRWDSRNIIPMKQKLDLTKEIAEATYLVQLSDHESFGLSVAESLILGTPVIITDLPAFKEIGCKHGKNAIVCDLEMKNVDIEMIKKGLPKFKYTPPKSNWSKYLDNNGKYRPNDKIKVITTRGYLDIVLGRLTRNTEVYMTKERVSELECKGLVERV